MGKARLEGSGGDMNAATDRPWWRSLICWWAHSRFAEWNDGGDLCCSRCNVIVWKGAAFTDDYRRLYDR